MSIPTELSANEQRVQASIQTALNLDNQTSLSELAREVTNSTILAAVRADYETFATMFHEGDLQRNPELRKHLEEHPDGMYAALLREMAHIETLPDIDTLGSTL